MSIILNGTTGITTPGLSADSPTLSVDSTNDRVGIGTTNPSTKLHVSGNVRIADASSASLFISRSSNTVTAQHFYTPSLDSPWYLYGENLTWTGEKIGITRRAEKPYYEAFAPAVGRKEFGFINKTSADTSFTGTDLIPSLVLTNYGSVGIGITSPNSNSVLDVNGSQWIVKDALYNSESFPGLYIRGSRSLGSVGLILGADNTTGLAYIQPLQAGTTYAQNMSICAMGGNVGIGTTNPSQKLDVRGNIAVGLGFGNAPAYTIEAGNTSAANHRLTFIGNASGTNDDVLFDLNKNGGAYGSFSVRFDGTTRMQIAGASLSNNGNITFDPVTNTIFQSGNVGIGTLSPAANLHVGKQENATAGAPGTVTRFSIQPYSNTGGPYNFIARTISGAADCLDTYYGPNHIMTWDLNGNVGIGVTNPTYRLHLASTAFIPTLALDSEYTMRAASVYTTGDTTFSFTFSAGTGNATYLVTAASSHYGYSTFSCMRQSYVHAYPNFSETNLHNYTTDAHGSWSFSWTNNILTVTHNAGSYAGSAYFWASVQGN